MPQNKISICTSVSVGSRRAIVVEASGDAALAAEYAFALYISPLYCARGLWRKGAGDEETREQNSAHPFGEGWAELFELELN